MTQRKKNRLRFRYYQDPGHGWVAIKIKLLKKLGIAEQISSFSYMRNDKAFLEEDCDMARLINRLDELGITYEFIECHSSKQSKIRNYPCYNSKA